MASTKLSVAAPLDLPIAVNVRAAARPDVNDIQDEVLRLFDAHAPGLRRYVGAFGLDSTAVEDVVQDTFVALFRHLIQERPRDRLSGWLFRVAHNLALKHQARVRRWRVTELPVVHYVDIEDQGDNPEEQLRERQRQDSLRGVVRALPARDRQCLHLRAEGLTYRDIAQTLGISLGSVAKSLARAFARLTRAASR